MNKRGFTLLEVLVAMAILTMIFVSTIAFNRIIQTSEDRVDKREELYQMGRIAIEKVTQDINMAFLVAKPELLGKTKDGANIEIAFIGEDRGNFDTLNFDSFSNWRMFRNSKESDQIEVGYYVEDIPDEPDTFRLMRRTNPYLDNDVTKDGKAYPLAEGIKEFQLSYYDAANGEWTDNWNSKDIEKKNKLPKAVKITISFPDPDLEDKTISFTTIAFIGLWENPLDF